MTQCITCGKKAHVEGGDSYYPYSGTTSAMLKLRLSEKGFFDFIHRTGQETTLLTE